MAKLNSFKVDSKLIEHGEWVSPGEEYDDLEIKCRGFTDTYTDVRSAKMRRAAMRFGGDVNKVPISLSREITVDCMIDHVLLDVRNIQDEHGQPVTFEQFCQLLKTPDYYDLVLACLRAAAVVGTHRIDDVQDAAKNLPKHSKSP